MVVTVATAATEREAAPDPNTLPADVEALEAREAPEAPEDWVQLGSFERVPEVSFYLRLAMVPLVARAVTVVAVVEVKMSQAIRMVVMAVVAAEVEVVVPVAAGM